MNTILIVGCGSIGERHLRCFLKTGRANILACDANTELLESMRERYGAETCSNWEEALGNPAIESVLIATPAHLHVTMASTALRAGKHVLIEKPLSVSLEGTKELLKLRDQQDKKVAVAYTYRSNPITRALKEFIEEGTLGLPLAVNAAGGQHFPHFRPAYREIYFASHAQGGGAIQDGITHLVNSVEWLTGPLDRIYCDAGHQALEGVSVEDTVNLLARSNRTLVNFSFNLFQAPNEVTITIHCEKGSIRGEYHKKRWGTLALGEEDWNYREVPVQERDSLYISQADAFLDEVEGKKTQLATLEEAIQTLRINIAALESSRTGQPITIHSG